MLELILAMAGMIAAALLFKRVGALETELTDLRARMTEMEIAEFRGKRPVADPQPVATPEPVPAQPLKRTPARVLRSEAMPDERSEPRPAPPAPPPPPPPPASEAPERAGLESLVGGRLPVWIGGAALVLAGFFLVRYTIESGLLGPGVRVALAALFSLTLVAASEAARRLVLTRDDPRIAQVLAGAGIASAYGTLYIAATQYGLVGAGAAFVLMVAITAAGLFLALRHGPPTAIMALIGGFAAPLVQGVDGAGVGPLIAYLALLIAALFALAVRRGWGWLAIATVVAGFGWANLLVVLLDRDAAGSIAGFVVVLAIAATLVLPRTGEGRPWLRVAPMVAGLVQLLVLAPVLQFGAVAWIFYLVLGGAALLLAWRDASLLPGAAAAAVLVVVLVAIGLNTPTLDAPDANMVAALIAAVLFGGSGALLSRRDPQWAATGLIGIAGPLLVAHASISDRLPDLAWTLLELAAAATAGLLAWRHRDRIAQRDIGLTFGSAVAAILAGTGLATLVGSAWAPLVLAPVVLALGLWARHLGDPTVARLPLIALVATLMIGGEPLGHLVNAGGAGLFGQSLIYPLLPGLGDAARQLAAPLAVAVALLWIDRGAFGRARTIVAGGALVLAAALLYLLVKQPLAIADMPRFTAYAFGERAAITLAFFAVGWLLAQRSRFVGAGQALAIFALFRFVWFDLLVFSPINVAQHVGAIPIANAAVVLPALLAAGALTIAKTQPWRYAALGATLIAVVAAVRQIAHGSLLVGPTGSGETWGYSAALLVLAVAWLWRGIATVSRTLRVAGLGLLTLVTLKVFLLDVAALGGLLRIVSLMGLGVALIGISWAYNRVMRPEGAATPAPAAGT